MGFQKCEFLDKMRIFAPVCSFDVRDREFDELLQIYSHLFDIFELGIDVSTQNVVSKSCLKKSKIVQNVLAKIPKLS